MYYYNGACEMEPPGFVKGKMNGPDVFENEYTLLNIDNVNTVDIAESSKIMLKSKYNNLTIGFGKASNNQIKNHIPKGLRIK